MFFDNLVEIAKVLLSFKSTGHQTLTLQPTLAGTDTGENKLV